MEAQLRARIEGLVSISKHPIRGIEHKTFRRLLYRNRNQHRHGFYFRKLDHVRRLLSQIDRHVAWESLQYSLGDNERKGSRTRAACPLSLSSLTMDDLKSVESVLHELVNKVILAAAETVVTHLVSREHFLPFAVSVLATLARLFVVERKVLTEVRGVSTEINVLFATEGHSGPSREYIRDGADLCDEDIGLEVPAPKEPESKSKQEVQAASSRYREAAMSEKRLPKIEAIHSSGPRRPGTQEPSLYDLVANSVDTSKFSVEVRERTSVCLPEVLRIHQGFEGTSKSSEGREVNLHEDMMSSRTLSLPRKKARECLRDSSRNARTERLGSGVQRNNKIGTEVSADSSDPDDIDDIFDALEDS